MRLILHLSGVKKYKVEKKHRDGSIKTWWKCNTTLSYKDTMPGDEIHIIKLIESDRNVKVVRHYWSNK